MQAGSRQKNRQTDSQVLHVSKLVYFKTQNGKLYCTPTKQKIEEQKKRTNYTDKRRLDEAGSKVMNLWRITNIKL